TSPSWSGQRAFGTRRSSCSGRPTRPSCTRWPTHSATGASASATSAGSGSPASTPPPARGDCPTTSSCTACARLAWRSTAKCSPTWPCATAAPLPGWSRLPSRASDDVGARPASPAAGAVPVAATLASPSSAHIDSPQNDLVRWLRRLGRDREPGLVLLEGPRVVVEAAACGVQFDLLATHEGVQAPEVVADRVVTLSQRAFAAASQTVSPQGVLAVGRLREASVGDARAAALAAGWPLVV